MYSKNRSWILKHLDFMIIDIISCKVAFLLSFMLRQGGGAYELIRGVYFSDAVDFNNIIFRDLYFAIFFLCILDVIFQKSHTDILKRGFLKEAKSCLKLSTAIFIELLIILFALKISASFSRLVLLYFWIGSTILMLIFRSCYKVILKAILGQDTYHKRHLILLATEEEMPSLVREFSEKQNDIRLSGCMIPAAGAADASGEVAAGHDGAGSEAAAGHRGAGSKTVSGHHETRSEAAAGHHRAGSETAASHHGAGSETVTGIPVVAKDPASALAYLKSHWVDEVFISRGMSGKAVDDFIRGCHVMGITTHQEINVEEDHTAEVAVETMAGTVVVTGSLRIIDPMLLLVKRIIDIIGSIIGMAFCALLTVFVAIPGILICDPGPVFYKQKRVGKNGRVFNLYKFRSMYLDADERKAALMKKNEMQGAIFKMKNDPRIIGSGPDGSRHGYGWFIRKTSIDEFPQFVNVFLGQMSLVGTRPPTLDEWQQYEAHHRVRLAVRPGITGVWQTSGRNQVSNFEDIVNLDLSYINNFSVGNDIRIIARTVKQIFKGEEGAE